MVELLGPFEPEQHRAAGLFRIAFAFDLYHAVPHLFADLAVVGMDFCDAVKPGRAAGRQQAAAAPGAERRVAEKDGDLGAILNRIEGGACAAVSIGEGVLVIDMDAAPRRDLGVAIGKPD